MTTILTYNIRNGGYDREDALQTIIATVQPDIVLLQEVFDTAILSRLAHALHLHSQSFFLARGRRRFHLGLISRYPIRSVRSYHRLPICNALLEATIVLPSDRQLRLWGVHLMPHLGAPFELWRLAEAAVLLQRTRRFQDDLCVMAGDFNTIAPGDRVLVHGLPRSLRRFVLAQGGRVYPWALTLVQREQWLDCYRCRHPRESGWTLPSHKPNARLDYVFANQALAPYLQTCSIITQPPLVHIASDHLPLRACFALEGN